MIMTKNSINVHFIHTNDFFITRCRMNFATFNSAIEMNLTPPTIFTGNDKKKQKASSFIVVLLTLLALQNLPAVAQKISRSQTASGGFYYWTTNSNWTDNAAPPVANIGNTLQNPGGNVQIQIENYITRSGSLSFANIGNNTREIVIKDTLVVYGNMTFDTNSYSLRMESGSVLIVLGDFSAANKVTVDNGGLIVIDGNMTLTGGNNEYVDNNGSGVPNLIVTGSISGNGDTAAASADSGPLTSAPPAIQNFVNSSGATPLPIVLNYFRAIETGGIVKLRWETLSEENFDYFEVQRSTDGKKFEVIATKKGHGFTSERHKYSYDDNSPSYGMNYYRLKAVDFDGSSETFHTVAVEVKPNFAQVKAYPNPNTGQSVNLAIPEDMIYTADLMTYVISDLNGRQLLDGEITSTDFTASFNEQLASGVYLITVNAGAYSSSIRLVVNQEQG